MGGLIDLHMHSTASDGILSPARLAEECFRLGVKYASLTDHDTAEGQAEFLAAASRLGIRTVSGIEFNVAHRCELHILGYGCDFSYKPLEDALAFLKNERSTRAQRIVDTLAKNGYLLSFDRIKELAGGGVIGRPHIAKALVERGYCKDVPQAFGDFLSRGGPGYVKRERLTSAQAINLIRQGGGRAVLAHPGCMENEDYPALLTRLKEEGLFGIEVFYPVHMDQQCEYFHRLAKEFSLETTCGTDYHGGRDKEVPPGGERRGQSHVLSSVKKLMINS